MRLAIIESPYAGNVALNERYARACLADSLRRGEGPFASHLLYTQPGVLNDSLPEERSTGMAAGLAWGARADVVAVYRDLGVSDGMLEGMRQAEAAGVPIEERAIGFGWAERSSGGLITIVGSFQLPRGMPPDDFRAALRGVRSDLKRRWSEIRGEKVSCAVCIDGMEQIAKDRVFSIHTQVFGLDIGVADILTEQISSAALSEHLPAGVTLQSLGTSMAAGSRHL